jgi:hypothetical protein
MLGCKSSLPMLRKRLQSVGVTSFTTSTLSQGRTQRWVLAWTFDKNIDLFKMDSTAEQQHNVNKVRVRGCLMLFILLMILF